MTRPGARECKMSAVLQECPTIPGLLCDEPQPQRTGQQSVIDNLRVTNAEQRVKLGMAEAEVDKLRQLLHEQQRLTSLLQMQLDAANTMRVIAERKLADRPVAEVTHDFSPGPNCAMVEVALPGGTKAIVEAYYMPGTTPTDVDPGEGVECWADRVLIATKHGDRLVSVVDLCAALQDDGAVLRAVEAA